MVSFNYERSSMPLNLEHTDGAFIYQFEALSFPPLTSSQERCAQRILSHARSRRPRCTLTTAGEPPQERYELRIAVAANSDQTMEVGQRYAERHQHANGEEGPKLLEEDELSVVP